MSVDSSSSSRSASISFLPWSDVFERGDQPGARLLYAALQLFQKGWLLLDGAEKGLNHWSSF